MYMIHQQDTPADLHPPLQRVEQYWAQLADGRPMPSRKDFHPHDLHWLFGHFYTVDILRGGADYRFGYVGDFWKALYASDLSGLLLSECEAFGKLMVLRASYDEAIRDRRPCYRTGRIVWPDQRSVHHERLTVPFAGDGGEPSMLLVAAQCDRSIGELMRYIGRREPQLILDEIRS
jgi:hypothetical protein